MGAYVGQHGVASLRRYKYSGVDHSLVAKHILQPFWSRFVHIFPLWFPPNMITLTGFMFLLTSAFLGFLYSPHLDTAPPRWVHLAHGLLLFLYQTFDAVDGKQARRTNSSSPLGELFDHGCDALACTFESLAFGSTAMCGMYTFWFWFISAVPFYLATWEHFFTNTLILPIVNGPTEGLMLIYLSHFFTFFTGAEWWAQDFRKSTPLLGWVSFVPEMPVYSIVLCLMIAFAVIPTIGSKSAMAVRRDALVRLLLLTVAASSAAGAKVPAMFVFGDSTADVGNNDYLPGSSSRANFPHNGVDFPGGKATGRFSNGLIGVDFLAFSMGFSKSPPPYLSLVANAANSSRSEVTRNMTKAAAACMTGANFASGGSGVLDSTGTTINMTKQIEYFSDLKDQMKTRLSANRVSALLLKSIFLISAGGNDAFDFFSQNRSSDSTEVQQFSEAVISTYDSHVKTLYNLGARKFAVINVPLIGCCPYWRSQHPIGECIEPLNQLANNLNDGIRELFSHLRSEMQGMKYSIASSYELVSSLIENPQAAGFEEVKSACCGGGRLNAEEGCTPKSSCCSDHSKYLFWDLLHPTQATSKFAGLAFYDGLAQFVSPITFKQLVEA